MNRSFALLLTAGLVIAVVGPRTCYCHAQVRTQRPPLILKHTDVVYVVLFSPDGQAVASSSQDGTIRLSRAGTGEEIRSFRHNKLWSCIAFSPDGKRLAASVSGSKVIVWDTAASQQPTTVQGHRQMVISLAFSPDGKTLATASEDDSVRLWDPVTGKNLASHETTGEGSRLVEDSLAFTADGKVLFLRNQAGSLGITVWDVNSGRVSAATMKHSGPVFSVTYSPDRKVCATGHGADLSDFFKSDEIRTLGGLGQFSKRMQEITDSTGEVRLWETATGKERAVLMGHTKPVWAVAFSPDGKSLATGGLDQTVKLWDVATAKQKASLKGHTANIHSVAFRPDGKMLASGSADGTVRLWDIDNLN